MSIFSIFKRKTFRYRAYSFSDGIARIKRSEDTDEAMLYYYKYGYIDKTGKMISKPQFKTRSLYWV